MCLTWAAGWSFVEAAVESAGDLRGDRKFPLREMLR
jgi:hypothetical protein